MEVVKSLLADYREEVQRCMRCGFCRALCPTWEFVGWETGSPRGRMQVIKALLDGEIEANEYVMDKIYKCALCGYCLWRCPSGVKTADVLKAARAHLVDKKRYPKVLDEIDAHLRENRSIYGLPREARTDWIEYMDVEGVVQAGRRAEVVYFPGCVSSLSSRTMSVAAATSLILDELGLHWTILGDNEWCCGNPLLLSGKRELAKDLAEHNVRAIRKLHAKTLLTSCAGCHRTFVQEYPWLVGDLGFQVRHVSQLLEEMLKQGKAEFRGKLGMTVTYHDPCELGRHAEVYEPPREVLKSIPGIEFVELPKNRFLTRCCGGGGVLKATNPDIALKLASKKLEEAHDVGADAIISSCPSCKLNILDAIAEQEDTLQMLDVTEIVAEAMNLKII